MADLVLTPVSATFLFVLACLAGHRYRRIWKSEGPHWQLWFFGVIAGSCLMVLGFLPLDY